MICLALPIAHSPAPSFDLQVLRFGHPGRDLAMTSLRASLVKYPLYYYSLLSTTDILTMTRSGLVIGVMVTCHCPVLAWGADLI